MTTGLALISQNRHGQVREFSLAKDKLLLGRSTQCDLFVLDPTISRKHAEITVHGIDVTVTDLGSRNGTYVAGNRIGTSVVRQGQIVTFGRLDFVLAGPLTKNASIEPEALTASCRDDTHDNDTLHGLSAAQRKVFDLALNGLSEKKLASRLRISRLTVHTHLRAVYRLLGVHSRAELLAKFLPGATMPPNNQLTIPHD